MTYLKCFWDETRPYESAAWGCSWWFFEFGPDGAITRHIEVYDNGVRLRYGPDHLKDEFGRLADARLQQMHMPAPETISAEDFERVWESVKSNGTVHSDGSEES